MIWNRFVTLCFLGALTAGTGAAQQADIPKSKDHPLVSRYPGSLITVYSVSEFDEFTLPLSKVNGEGAFEKSQHLEGKITRIGYATPAGRSILEVYRNYESALQKGGFTTLFSCANAECGFSGGAKLFTTEEDDWVWNSGHRYISAKLARAEGDVYVSMHIGQWSDLSRGTLIMLYVIEATPPCMASTSIPPRRRSSPSPTPRSRRSPNFSSKQRSSNCSSSATPTMSEASRRIWISPSAARTPWSRL